MYKFSVLSRNSSEVSSLTAIFCTMSSWIWLKYSAHAPHPTISPLSPPRMHYHWQKRSWSAYLLLMTGLTRRRSLKGMWAVVAHVLVNIFWRCRHYIPWAVGLQAERVYWTAWRCSFQSTCWRTEGGPSPQGVVHLLLAVTSFFEVVVVHFLGLSL